MKSSFQLLNFHKHRQLASLLPVLGRLITNLALGLLLSVPVAAINPQLPTEPGKLYGEQQETNDEEVEPYDEENDCDGTDFSHDPYSNSGCETCPKPDSGEDTDTDTDTETDTGDLGCISEQIPLAARILQIVDVYDALTTERPYKKALPTLEAFAIMREEVKRGWWDGSILDQFEAVVHGYEPVTTGRVR